MRSCLVGLLTLVSLQALAADSWQPLPADPARFVGSLSCSATSCHGRAEPFHGGFVQRQEYLHFLQDDPHAQAAKRLTQPPYLEVLNRTLQPEALPAAAQRCAGCHDPLGAAGEAAHLPLGRGIGCESCHGPARDWLAEHYQRGISRERLARLGMVDTRQVLPRARMCAGCHVGGVGRDVNHDLLAAGHPPLLFELGSHQALMGRKHWDEAPRRSREPNYDAQLWAAGRIASADAALALLAARAAQATRAAPWPEFAESNCRSCHRPLTAVASSAAGRLGWQGWNLALIRPTPALEALRTEMERSLIPSPDTIVILAAEAQAALRRQVRLSAEGQLLNAEGLPISATDVLSATNQGPSSWESACQELAALLAAQRPGELKPLGQIAARLRRNDPPLAEIAAELAALRQAMSQKRSPP